MATFKTRRLHTAQGGITVPSGGITASGGVTITGGLTVNSGGITVSGCSFTSSCGLKVGASGTTVTQILAGSVSACFLEMADGASAAGSAAIPYVAVGDIIYLQTACTTGSAFITSASVTGAGAVTFKTYNSSSGTAAASTIKLQYIAVRPG